mmetsp:Transcript_66899/g.111953  ORF Transcript_66899/g.111953 Transcript_66899/m.111953 type:complete len:108 (+) Transcript_66899:1279-1602(+)
MCRPKPFPQSILASQAERARGFTVFIAFSSVFQISVFAFRVFKGWGQGQSPFLPFPQYQVSCRLSGCVRGKHSARHTPVIHCPRIARMVHKAQNRKEWDSLRESGKT